MSFVSLSSLYVSSLIQTQTKLLNYLKKVFFQGNWMQWLFSQFYMLKKPPLEASDLLQSRLTALYTWWGLPFWVFLLECPGGFLLLLSCVAFLPIPHFTLPWSR